MSAEALQPDRDRRASLTRWVNDHPSSCLELRDSECSYYLLLKLRERQTKVTSVKAVTEKNITEEYIFVLRYVPLISSVQLESLLTEIFQWMLVLNCVSRVRGIYEGI